MPDIISGNSSIEISRTTKGEYSYNIKIYFSGNTISIMKGIVDRIDSVMKYLENKLRSEGNKLRSEGNKDE